MSDFVQLFQASFHIVNLPYTLLLLLVLIYWGTVILGMLDMSTLDVDVGDSNIDLDADFEIHGLYEYFNIRHIPVSILISFFAVSLWVFGVLVNHYLHGTRSLLLGGLVFCANIVVSAHVAKFVTTPLKPLFKSLRGEASANRNLIGSRCVVTSSKVDVSYGQAQIEEEGAPITLMVRTEGEEIVRKGEEAVILRPAAEQGIYIITKLEMEV